MSAVDVRHAIAQADVALGVAGLSPDDIFRRELRAASAAVAELIAERDALLQENESLRNKAAYWDDLIHARETVQKDSDDCEWKQLASRRQLIEAIKSCRAAHGFSLREAKDCVEGYIISTRGAAP